MTINLNVNEKFKPFITRHKPFKVLIGGRGSGKSIGVADIMTFFMLTEASSLMCLREYQKSVEDSVHSVIKESITERLKLNDWAITDKYIKAPNGAKTSYIGAARNPASLQSMHGFKRAWYEEAQAASQDSLDKLIPTILRVPGAECWFTANPQASGDPFSQRFIVPFMKYLERDGYYEDDMHMIAVVNWRDNPWWNKISNDLRLLDFKTLPRAKYDHIWEGRFNDTVDNSIIQPEWFDAAKDLHKNPKFEEMFKPHGAVIASHDPFDDGGDAAGYACRHGSIITEVRTKRQGEIDECMDWATDLAIKAGADWFTWDGDGMGAGLKRQVSDAFKGKPTKYHMFRGSLSGIGQDDADEIYMPVDDGKPEDKTKTFANTFKNNRAQFYIRLANKFENSYKALVKGKYIDPEDMISLNLEGIDDIVSLRSQVCRIPSKKNDQGLIQIMSKKDMAKLKIPSPNEADALMMAMFMPPIEEDDDDFKIKFTDWGP